VTIVSSFRDGIFKITLPEFGWERGHELQFCSPSLSVLVQNPPPRRSNLRPGFVWPRPISVQYFGLLARSLNGVNSLPRQVASSRD
jgi:hypothetical protein